jgi:hypothetical protein
LHIPSRTRQIQSCALTSHLVLVSAYRKHAIVVEVIELLQKFGDRLLGRATVSTSAPTPQIGYFDMCGESFAFELFHCGFSDMGYAYCECCGRTALLSGWSQNIPAGAPLRIHEVIDPPTESYLQSCECGGAFRSNASPRCPECHEPLSAEAAATWIEANAPGTKVGWRWQRSWVGLYTVVIAKRSVSDNWLTNETR